MIAPSPRLPRASRLNCEALEDRLLLTIGSEFLVNTANTTADQNGANVASALSATNTADVLHIAIWSTNGAKGQRYNAAGTAVGTELGLNHYGDVAMDDEGNFVIVWTDQDIHFDQYGADGVFIRTGAVTSTAAYNEFAPAVAIDADGDFLVSYSREKKEGKTDIYAARFSAAGTLLGELKVAKSKKPENYSDVACASDGRCAIVWNQSGKIMLNRYDATGAVLGKHKVAKIDDDIRASIEPSLAMDDTGMALVVYEDASADQENFEFHARKVTGAGAMLDDVVVVSSNFLTEQVFSPRVAIDRSDSSFVVVYDSIPSGVGSDSSHAKVRELTPEGNEIVTHDLGVGTDIPAISMAGNDAYFVGYQGSEPNHPTAEDDDVFGRFGAA